MVIKISLAICLIVLCFGSIGISGFYKKSYQGDLRLHLQESKILELPRIAEVEKGRKA